MRSIRSNLNRISRLLLGGWLSSGTISSVDDFTEFVSTRSAYVAQTALFGYLKARMGTSFRQYFEDDEYSRIIHAASVKFFVSCLSDLTVYSVAHLVESTNLSNERACAFARRLFEAGLLAGVDDRDRAMIPPEAIQRFQDRIETTVWLDAARRDAAFRGSIEDLARFAPVVDEFKMLDYEIVRNSMRFRWHDVRQRLKKRLSANEVVRSAIGP